MMDLTIAELREELAALVDSGVDPETPFLVWVKGGNLKHLKSKTVAYNPGIGAYAKTADAK